MTQPNMSRAPFHLKYSRKTDFEPEFVSIGPYYNIKELNDNQFMTTVKNRCTSYFRNKLPTTEQPILPRPGIYSDIDFLVYSIDPFHMEKEIRDWYGGTTDLDFPSEELFRILVHDSCFIIRIILAISRPVHESMFFRLGVDIKKVRFDILLLENQIPFFFLLKVYEFFHNNGMLPPMPPLNSAQNLPTMERNQPIPETRPPMFSCRFCEVVISIKKKPLPRNEQNSTTQPISQQSPLAQPTDQDSAILNQFLKELEPFICLDMPWKFNNEYGKIDKPVHLLHLYWKCCLPFPWKETNPEGSNKCNHCGNVVPFNPVPESWVNIHLRSNSYKRIKSAHDLYYRAGVDFQKRKHKDGFNVTFQNGTLQLPHLQLDRSHTKLLINLVALEESKPSNVRVMTSYILLLDGLINTEKDMELLERHGVITNKLGSSQIASSYFNDIGNACTIDYQHHYCHKQFDALNRYYQSTWTHQFAKLQHNYCNSPWKFISLVAGSALLIMSAVQTYYNISRYYHHHD